MVASTHITSAEVRCSDGRLAAVVDLVRVGGGEQVVTVDGVPETRVHPSSTVYHVRLVSPDRMLPDTLREAGDYDAAVKLGEAYADRLEAHAADLERLAVDLAV